MPEKKKTTVSAEDIGRFLEQTGFVFEMRMHEVFVKSGYTCAIGETFVDLEGGTDREIDIIASKLLNNINIHFVVECKQSVLDKWIFICTKSNSDRFYANRKQLPHVPLEALRETKLFSHFHTYDRNILLAHNYICYSLANNKKSATLQIDECVRKLPKALIDLASRAEGGKHLFFPVGLFSGQIFAATYKGSLVLEEKRFLQCFTIFRSDAYRYARTREKSSTVITTIFPALDELERMTADFQLERIRKTAGELGGPYCIDFVTAAGLPEYIQVVEKEVAAVREGDWPVPTARESAPS